jgi:hypothetical protein
MAVSEEAPSTTAIDWDAVRERLSEAITSIRQDVLDRERRLVSLRGDQQSAAFRNAIEARVQRAQSRLADLNSRGAAEFPIRMATAQLQKANRELEDVNRPAAPPPSVTVEELPVAVGFLRVGGR